MEEVEVEGGGLRDMSSIKGAISASRQDYNSEMAISECWIAPDASGIVDRVLLRQMQLVQASNGIRHQSAAGAV